MGKMGRKKKIFLGVVILLIGILAALGIWQRNNLSALRLALHYSGEDLTSQMVDSREQLTDALREQADVTVRDLTQEEKQALTESTVSREELIEELVKPQEPETPSDPAEVPAEDPVQAELSRCIAELYVMQAEYTTWLAQANQAAIDEFVALPEEQQTATNKHKIGLRYLGLAKDKERECDAEMKVMEEKIRGLLKDLGQDTGLVEEIHETYLNEKALKKAYYLSLH